MSSFFRRAGSALICAALAGLTAAASYAQQPQTQPSRKLPNVVIRTPDAKGINLARYRGKEIVLFLFSTECDECVVTASYMAKIQTDMGSHGLQVIGIAANHTAPYTVNGWVQRYRPPFPVGFLDQDSMLKLIAAGKDSRPFVPIVMFVDSIGVVRQQYSGDSPLFKDNAPTEKALRAIASNLLTWQAQQAKARAAAKAAQEKRDEEKKEEAKPEAKPDPSKEP